MQQITRRKCITTTVEFAAACALSTIGSAGECQPTAPERTVEEWMNEWMKNARATKGALHVARFKDPTYVLLKQIKWEPEPSQKDKYDPVEVPIGFVTDFASIPRLFWSALRPDGEYTYPAIIHDYLYWTQTRRREVADEIFKVVMEEFGIAAITRNSIYFAVRSFGQSSWDGNGKLKAGGEKRILTKWPDDEIDPKITWAEWRQMNDVFASPQ
jgi:hypothetical protein